MVGKLISLLEGEDSTLDFKRLDEVMPVLGHSNLWKPWSHSCAPRLIKTHQPYRKFLFDRPRRAVYVARDPRDCMVSYFHYLKNHRWFEIGDDFGAFIRSPRHGLEPCIRHFLSWQPRVTHLVRYEDMKSDARTEMEALFRALDMNVPNWALRQAITETSFQVMRKEEATRGIRNSERFGPRFEAVRKGKSGEWREVFSARDLDYYRDLCDSHRFFCYV